MRPIAAAALLNNIREKSRRMFIEGTRRMSKKRNQPLMLMPIALPGLLDLNDYARPINRQPRTARRRMKSQPELVPPHVKLVRTRWFRREAVLSHMVSLETPSGEPATKRTRRAR
jgi:hypothetical protein